MINIKPSTYEYDEWYVVQNDVIGGWDISTLNKPPSQYTREEIQQFPTIAECTFKSVAEYIVQLHNEAVNSID